MSNTRPYETKQQTQLSNGLSISALVLGLLSLFIGFFSAIPGIIVGHIARSRVKQAPHQYGGGGMALAGLIISYAVIILTLVVVYVVVTNPEIQEALKQALEQAKQQAQ